MSEELPLHVRKKVANKYEETLTELSVDELTDYTLKTNIIVITYNTGRNNQKTIRMDYATEPYSDDLPETWRTFRKGEEKYAFDVEEIALYSRNGETPYRIATEDDIISFEKVSFPEPPVIVGEEQEDVVARVYYRKNGERKLYTVDVEVDSIYDRRLRGTDVKKDRDIKVILRGSRDVLSRKKYTDYKIGKVARVEFPKGYKFSLNVTPVKKEREDQVKNRIQKQLKKRGLEVEFNDSEFIDVNHEDY